MHNLRRARPGSAVVDPKRQKKTINVMICAYPAANIQRPTENSNFFEIFEKNSKIFSKNLIFTP